MPLAIAIPAIATAVAGGAAATGQIVASHKAGNANKRALEVQERSTAQALALERDNENRRRMEHDQQQLELRRQFDAEQARRDPYRQFSEAILRKRAARRGVPMPSVQRPAFQSQAYQPTTTLGTLGRP